MGLERKRSSRRSNFGRYQPPKKKTPSSRCKTCCRKFTAFMFSHVGLCGLVVGYSILGAFAFQALEETFEDSKSGKMVETRIKTVEELWDITYKLNILYKDNWTDLVTKKIKTFQSEVIAAAKDGYEGEDSPRKKWSFSRAFLYSLTVITTIGYGNIAPRTQWGKVVTIVYAIIGIPLMLLYLTNIGDILAKSFKYLYSRICRCSGHSRDPYKRRGARSGGGANNENYRAHHVVAHNSPNKQGVGGGGTLNDAANKIVLGSGGGVVGGVGCHVSEDEVRIEAIPDGGGVGMGMEEDDEDGDYEKPRVTVPITLCLVILVGYIMGGAFLFSMWEDWDFLDGSYFCFITLSTIGFGDLVPGDSITGNSGSQEKLVLCSLYLLVGMAVIAMCFNLMQEEVIHKGSRPCGRTKRLHQQQTHSKQTPILLLPPLPPPPPPPVITFDLTANTHPRVTSSAFHLPVMERSSVL